MESLNAEIIRCLTLAPHSLSELVHGIPLHKPLQIRLLVGALLRETVITRLEGRTDNGAPIYCLPGYVEASGRRDHDDQRLARDYGSQCYSSPAWTADV
jgi:hypothetical protein